MIEVVTQEEQEREDSHAEAVAMLERALAMAKERKLEGVAITFVFADGCYGRLVPTEMRDAARLIGAVQTTVNDLIGRTLAT